MNEQKEISDFVLDYSEIKGLPIREIKNVDEIYELPAQKMTD